MQHLGQAGSVIENDRVHAGSALRRVVLHRIVSVPEREEEEPRPVRLLHRVFQALEHRRHRLRHHALPKKCNIPQILQVAAEVKRNRPALCACSTVSFSRLSTASTASAIMPCKPFNCSLKTLRRCREPPAMHGTEEGLLPMYAMRSGKVNLHQ